MSLYVVSHYLKSQNADVIKGLYQKRLKDNILHKNLKMLLKRQKGTLMHQAGCPGDYFFLTLLHIIRLG